MLSLIPIPVNHGFILLSLIFTLLFGNGIVCINAFIEDTQELVCDQIIPGFDFVGHGFDIRYEAFAYQLKGPIFDFQSDPILISSFQVIPGGLNFCYSRELYVSISNEVSSVTNIYTKFTDVRNFLANSLGLPFQLGMFANSTGAGNTTLLSLNKVAFSIFQRSVLYTSNSQDFRTFYILKLLNGPNLPRQNFTEDLEFAWNNCANVTPSEDGVKRCFLDFVGKYGTHYVRDATMGASIEFSSSVNKTTTISNSNTTLLFQKKDMTVLEFKKLVERSLKLYKILLSNKRGLASTINTPTVTTTQQNAQFTVLGGSPDQQQLITNAFNYLIHSQSYGNVFTFSTFFFRNTTQDVIGNWESTIYDYPYPIQYTLESIVSLVPFEYRSELEENIAYLLFKAAQPPEPPSYPEIISVSSPYTFNCIQISWLEPIDNSALITGYQIDFDNGTYMGLGVGPTLYPIITTVTGISSTTFQYTQCGFIECTAYKVCVRAINQIGISIPCLGDSNLVSIAETDPWKPTGVFFSTAIPGKRNLIIEWEYPKDYCSPILYYTLLVQDALFHGTVLYTNVNVTNTIGQSFDVTGLIPFTNYTWVITATNFYGTYAQPPIVFENSTLPAEPNPPAAPIVLNVSLNFITIQWSAPTDNGRPIDEYEIMVIGDGELQPIYFNTTNLIEILQPLQSSTNYNISVRAHNAIGWGNFSDIVSQETNYPPPTPPSNFNFDISWYYFIISFNETFTDPTPPKAVTEELTVAVNSTGQIVFNQQYTQLTYQSNSIPFSFNVTGLQSGTIYTYFITTTFITNPGSHGKLPPSTVSTPQNIQTLLPQVPSQVLDFNLIAYFTHIMEFNYSRANENGSPITNYLITCNSATQNATQNLGVVLIGNITNLLPSTLYNCYIQAENAIGFGPASNIITQTTLFGATQMSPPIVQSTSSYSLTIIWDPASANLDSTLSTSGDLWLVQMTNTSVCTPNCIASYPFSSSFAVWTSNLTWATTYGFSVSVSFDGGRSPSFSNPSYNSTLPLVTTAMQTTAMQTTAMQTTAMQTTAMQTTAVQTTAMLTTVTMQTTMQQTTSQQTTSLLTTG